MADKIPRKLEEQVAALDKHLKLLEEYYDRAFNKNEIEFYGEIACKLRLLAIKTNANKPLLIKIQNITGHNYKYETKTRNGIIAETLKEYMDSFGCVIRNSDNELKKFSKKDVIVMYAQQIGGCHEDSSINDELHKMINDDMKLNGNPPVISLLGAVTRSVLAIGKDVMKELKK